MQTHAICKLEEIVSITKRVSLHRKLLISYKLIINCTGIALRYKLREELNLNKISCLSVCPALKTKLMNRFR